MNFSCCKAERRDNARVFRACEVVKTGGGSVPAACVRVCRDTNLSAAIVPRLSYTDRTKKKTTKELCHPITKGQKAITVRGKSPSHFIEEEEQV